MNVRIPMFLLILALMTILAAPLSAVAITQEASPATPSLLTGLGLPTLDYTVTDDGIEMAAEIAAGPVLVTGSNQSSGYITVDFAQLPAEGSVEEFIEIGSSEVVQIPAWGANLVITGGLSLEPGATGSEVVWLEPGEYTAIAAGDVAVANPTAPLTVTGEPATDAADAVPSDLSVSLGAYSFDFPETVAAGQQIWRITNGHEGLLHHVVVFQVDQPYTTDEVVSGLVGIFGGTPVAGGFSFDSIVANPLSSSVLSYGQTVWAETDLAPGHYVAICFLPDPAGSEPHLLHGMVDTFEVPAA